jgi:spore maturation protein CgeB
MRDSAALADRLRLLIDSLDRRAVMGAHALEKVARYGFDADREGLLAALDSIVGKKARVAA